METGFYLKNQDIEARILQKMVFSDCERAVAWQLVKQDLTMYTIALAREREEILAQREKLRRNIAILEQEMAWQRKAYNLKLQKITQAERLSFNRNQPRVPSGSANGGQWTSGGGGGARRTDNGGGGDSFFGGGGSSFSQFADSAADTFDSSYTSEFSDSFDSETSYDLPYGYAPDGTGITPIGILEDRPVDLVKEEMAGGHAIERHVAKSDEELKSRFVNMREYRRGLFITTIRQPDGVGSFDSLEDGNYFVNRVIEDNRPQLTSELNNPIYNREPLMINQRFGYRTGKEAWAPTVTDFPSMRSTYSVRVVFKKDILKNDWRIITAFPYNMKQEKKDE